MEELIDLVDEKIGETELDKFMIGLNTLKEKDKYINWYKGLTALSLSQIAREKGIQNYKINVTTSATSGFIQTPHFGKDYQREIFYFSAQYKFYFVNVLSQVSSNQILVFEVKGDLKETDGGTEKINVEKEKESLLSNTNSGSFYKKFEFNVTEDKDIIISFWRRTQSIHVEEWKNKRMTGMEIKWYSAL